MQFALRGPFVGLAYFTLLAKTREAFAGLGVDPETFAMHVLRVSGATESARAEVPDRLRLNQGGWRSEVTLRGYTRECLPVQTRVNQAMLRLLDAGDSPDFE